MNLFRLEMSSSVEIAVPRYHAWEVFAGIGRWTGWCGVCKRADVGPGFDWRPAQKIALQFRMAGMNVSFNVAVTESEPGRRVAWASTKFNVTAVRTFTFEEMAWNRAIVTDHKLFTSSMLPIKLFYPRLVIRRMTESMLADLKAECERTGRK